MTPQEFADKLVALIDQAREAGVGNEEISAILDDAADALDEGVS